MLKVATIQSTRISTSKDDTSHASSHRASPRLSNQVPDKDALKGAMLIVSCQARKRRFENQLHQL